MQNLNLYRSLVVFSLVVPLSIFLGYLATDPTSYIGIVIIVSVITLLMSPLILKHHHLLTIISVNLYLNVFFLPGQPQAWGVMALIGLGITVLGWIINKKKWLVWDNALAMPLIMLLAVILVTAALTGGISGRALGATQWGAGRYLAAILGVLVFFAISIIPINPKHAKLLLILFLLTGTSAVISNLVFFAGPGFYFLFNFFPVELSAFAGDFSGTGLERLNGFSTGAYFALIAMLAAYGLKGIFSIKTPWRLVLFLGLILIGLLGGFRSFLVKLAFLMFILFVLERMFSFKYLFAMLFISIISYVGLISFSTHLPFSMQRAVSFVPFVKVAPSVRIDAQGSLKWRFEMWEIVLPDVPKYLLLGKGFSFDGTDYMLTQTAIQRNQLPAYEGTLVSGNYHNGLLTLIIPFGIFGTIFFFWFLFAAWKRLYHYYKNGPPELRAVNLFVFAFFSQQAFHYVVFYGQFDLDIIRFTSLAALSISINRGYEYYRLSDQRLAPVSSAEEAEPSAMPGLRGAIASGNA